MKRFQKDCLSDIVSIGALTLSPRAGQAVFVVQRPNLEKDKYDRFLFSLDTRTGETRQLTFGGNESSFCFIEGGDALLFPGLREEKDRKRVENGEELTAFYRLPLDGGEACELFRLPLSVGGIYALAGGRLLLEVDFDLSRPDLTGLKGERLEKALAAIRAERDYEVCDERPYRFDGRGYVNKTRNRLYVCDAQGRGLKAVTAPHFNVSSVSIAPDGRSFFFSGEEYTVARTTQEGLYRGCAESGETQKLCQADCFITSAAQVGELVFFGTENAKEESCLYSVPLAGGQPRLEIEMEQELGFYSVADPCGGGGVHFTGDKGQLYFTVTDRRATHLYRLTPGQEPERLSDGAVNVHHFAIDGDRVLCACLPDFGMMEIFVCQDGRCRQLTRFNAPIMRKYDFVRPEYLPFDNRSGLDLDGWVMLPPEAEKGRVPGILLIHGGPHAEFLGTLSFDAEVMASQGYAVFFCNPRGGSGRSRDFANLAGRYGTIDFDDLMDFTDAVLEKYPQIDGQRLAVLGGSYGGYMTNWIIGHTDRFKAAVPQCSISNWITMYGCCDIPEFVTQTQGGTPWSAYESLWRSSPLKYADKVKTPTLFLQYMCDYRCPMDQAIQMYYALHSHNVDTRLVLFEGDSHTMARTGKPSHRVRRYTEMFAWLDKYLK